MPSAQRKIPVTYLPHTGKRTTKIVHLRPDPESTAVSCGGEARFITNNVGAVTCEDCLAVINDTVVVANDELEPPDAPEIDTPVKIRSSEDLKAWRARHKISLRRLAKATGLNWSTIHRYEAGVLPIPRTFELALNSLEVLL